MPPMDPAGDPQLAERRCAMKQRARLIEYAIVAAASALIFGPVSGLIGAAIAIAAWEAGSAVLRKCNTRRRG